MDRAPGWVAVEEWMECDMRMGRWIRRTAMAFGLAMAVVVSAVGVSGAPAQAAGLEWLKFPLQVNNKVPTVIGATGQVVQQPYHDSGYKQWRYIHHNEWFSLQNRITGLCLDVGGISNGADVFVASCDGTRSQLWKLRTDMDPGAGYWALQNKWADYKGKFMVLTVWDFTNPVSELTLWDHYGGSDQRWGVVGVA
jgi:hypothetical protein